MTLASGQTQPDAIAVDATSVYWLDPGVEQYIGTWAIMKVGLSGGTPATLASGAGCAWQLAIDATSAYWTAAGQNSMTVALMRVPLAGGSASTFASGAWGSGQALAVDPTSVHLATYTSCTNGPNGEVCTPSLLRFPLSGGSPTTLFSGQAYSIPSIAVDSTSVYWATYSPSSTVPSGTIMRIPVTGGTPATIASDAARSIALDSTSIYWSGSGGSPPDIYSAVKAPLSGGAQTTLASGLTVPVPIVVDATNAYWVNGYDKTVVSVPLGGGTVTTLASMQKNASAAAVDATSLYWTNAGDTGLSDGTVIKVSPK